MSEAELIDLEEIVRDYAGGFLDSHQKKDADLKNPIIDWSRMFVTYGKLIYNNDRKLTNFMSTWDHGPLVRYVLNIWSSVETFFVLHANYYTLSA